MPKTARTKFSRTGGGPQGRPGEGEKWTGREERSDKQGLHIANALKKTIDTHQKRTPEKRETSKKRHQGKKDNRREIIKAVKLRAKGSDVTWKKEDLAEKIREQGNNKKIPLHSIEVSQTPRRNNKEPQHKPGRGKKRATFKTPMKPTRNSRKPSQKGPLDMMMTAAISSFSYSQPDAYEHTTSTPGQSPHMPGDSNRKEPVLPKPTTYVTRRVHRKPKTREAMQTWRDAAPTPAPGRLAGAPADLLTLYKTPRHPKLHSNHRPSHPSEMDRDRTIHGYTYRPAYRNPYNQYHHGRYANRMDHAMSHREVMLIIMSIIAAPLIVGTSPTTHRPEWCGESTPSAPSDSSCTELQPARTTGRLE